jgi:hypothetical protein
MTAPIAQLIGDSQQPDALASDVKVMPNTFGLSWRIALGSFASAYGHVQTYARQLKSVEARW